ncbi:sigma-70 family RNA polymerase sigma factor [Priestia megaterium]|nr:sigma-70 family RNA polymerase sigma factor [Priestia megaterium]
MCSFFEVVEKVIAIFNYEDISEGRCVENFVKENEEFLNNVIVKSFLEKEEHKLLLLDVICNHNQANREKLDLEFKKFYFNIRFISFVSNTLYFNAVNYDKKYRKISKRHPLTVDKPLGDEEDSSFKDLIIDTNADIRVEELLNSLDIEDYVANPTLYAAIKELSPKQKQVLNLVYVNGLTDTEVSKRLGKSQQAISKLHKKALGKIAGYITDKGGDIRDGY